MSQLTLRVTDDLARQLKRTAAGRGQSVNAFAVLVLRALVDPDASGTDVERVRERLRAAGLVVDPPTLP